MNTVGAFVEYDVTEAEMLRLIEHHHRFSPTSRALRAATTALAAAVGATAAYAAGEGWRSILWAAVGAVLVGVLYRWGGPAFNRAVWRRSLREGKGAPFGRHSLSISAEGVRSISAESESLLRWSAIDRVDSDADCMYLMVTGGGIPIPRAAFASAPEFDRFLGAARELHRLGNRGLDV